jgi:hypothetical protein
MTSVDPDTILTIDGGWKNVYGQKNFENCSQRSS